MRILHHARIYTPEPAGPAVTALAIDRGLIIAMGSDDEVLALRQHGAEVEDLGGRTVWPGLIDAHLHLQHYAASLQLVDCETATKEECLRRVAERARSAKPGDWILGHGWNQNLWPEGFGDADELEAAAPGHPVYLTAKSLHAAWANRTAMQLAGITAATPDPEDGSLLRDASGRPTGILLEEAMQLVAGHLLAASADEISRQIEQAQANLWQVGLTGVHDLDRRDCFIALQQLDREGKLRLRVVKGIPAEDLEHAAALGLRSGFGSDFLHIGPVKFFADGALGPQTAAMFQPYNGSPDNTGVLMLDSEHLFEAGQTAVRGGLSLAVHAIGDRAVHEVIEAYAQLRAFEQSEGLPALRHRIEHVQVLHPQDVSRLAQLDVIASMQPIHATSDMFTADRYWGERSALAYAFRTLLDQGTRLAFGSDAPVEPPNPFLGMHAAVHRRLPSGEPGEDGWRPEQRIRLAEALASYTTGAAYAGGLEDRLGRLVPGYKADLIVLPEDPFQLPPDRLYDLRPEATMVAGEWVWRSR